MNKKYFAIIGIVLTVLHLTFYFFMKYHWLYFILGFGVIYLVFVLPVKRQVI
ncbi:hypothetical protein HOD38_05200 [archaeon]|nr:hypothetical protein [archaeon]MBT4397636.1 hypothetical protein [archaeon]MBT4441668.1 hypothetical protein [archaeon]